MGHGSLDRNPYKDCAKSLKGPHIFLLTPSRGLFSMGVKWGGLGTIPTKHVHPRLPSIWQNSLWAARMAHDDMWRAERLRPAAARSPHTPPPQCSLQRLGKRERAQLSTGSRASKWGSMSSN